MAHALKIQAAKPADYGLIVLLAAIFGASFMLTNIAVAEIPAASLVAIRLVIAAVFFVAVMLLNGQKFPPLGPIWIFIALAGFFGNALPFFLISWGQERVDAGLAAILMATMPLMTILIAHLLTNDEKLTPFKIIGFVLGLLGVAYMIGFDKLGTLGDETIRQYAITGGALCYAVASIVTKSLVDMPRWAMMACVMISSSVMILPVSFILDNPLEYFTSNQPSGLAMATTLLLAIFPTIIGTALVFTIVNRQGASFLSQINFMVPIFGVLWAAIFLGEILPTKAVIALVLILAGIAIARITSLASLGSGGSAK